MRLPEDIAATWELTENVRCRDLILNATQSDRWLLDLTHAFIFEDTPKSKNAFLTVSMMDCVNYDMPNVVYDICDEVQRAILDQLRILPISR